MAPEGRLIGGLALGPGMLSGEKMNSPARHTERSTQLTNSPSRSGIRKVLSHALRHAPGEYGLVLDPKGRAPVPRVLAALHRLGPEWEAVDEVMLHGVLEAAGKMRHQMSNGRNGQCTAILCRSDRRRNPLSLPRCFSMGPRGIPSRSFALPGSCPWGAGMFTWRRPWSRRGKFDSVKTILLRFLRLIPVWRCHKVFPFIGRSPEFGCPVPFLRRRLRSWILPADDSRRG